MGGPWGGGLGNFADTEVANDAAEADGGRVGGGEEVDNMLVLPLDHDVERNHRSTRVAELWTRHSMSDKGLK